MNPPARQPETWNEDDVMTRHAILGASVLLAGLLAAGCERPGSTAPGDGPGAASGQYLLAEEPGGAKGVVEVRKAARDGDEVVVVGRIGGSDKPFTGRASFTIVDPVLEPCEEDGCGDPWCSTDPDELKEATTLVKFVDDHGRTRPDDAESTLGLKPLQTVVVKGRAKRDAAGNLTVLADGLYRRPAGEK
jgi:hypothetical protein